MIQIGRLLSLGEHWMMGSTSKIVENPWIPYAVLEGVSIDEVNKERLRRNKRDLETRGFSALGVFFGLPVGYLVFCDYPLLNLKTGEVERFEVFRIVNNRVGGRVFSPDQFQELKYSGKYHDKLKNPVCKQVD